MARIRTIKPDFFTSEDIVNLSPLARLLYIATWLEADREGRLMWRTKTFKLRYFPGDDCNIDKLAKELVDSKLVLLYEHEGQEYAEIPTFPKHQVVNNRESASVLPSRVDLTSSTRGARVNHASVTPLTGREGRKEGKGIYDASKFDAFYSSYPKKKNVADAEKAFKAIGVDESLMMKIMSALSIAKQSRDWMKNDGEFIPYPATWLRAKAWEDEVFSSESSDLMAGVT